MSPATSSIQAAESATSSATLLFVDDEPAILHSLRRLFRNSGYTLRFAGSAAEGLSLLEQEDVDVVVSDMRMPEVDGAAFLQEVRKRWPKTQRLLLTGYADIASTVAAINRGGIERYIAKPWDDQELLSLVADSATHRLLEKRNEALAALASRQAAELARLNQELEGRVAARTAELEQVAAMLELAYADLDQTFMETMEVLPGLFELRVDGHAGHSREIGRLCKAAATELGLPSRQVRDIYLAGLLHALGMISLPDALVRKPLQSMSQDEQARWHRHPLAAQAALMPIRALHSVVSLIRAQYERHDGLGFPDGLAGDELPLGAQILAVARSYVELTRGLLSDRRYSSEDALALLRSRCGTHHRDDVFDAVERAVAASVSHPKTPAIQLEVKDLRPGMVLANDLLSSKGTLLLAAGYRFDEPSIRTIQDLLTREQTRLAFPVRSFDTGQVAAAA